MPTNLAVVRRQRRALVQLGGERVQLGALCAQVFTDTRQSVRQRARLQAMRAVSVGAR